MRALADPLPLISQLEHTPQNPRWHAEGDVARHTALVFAEAAQLADAEALPPDERLILLLAAALHDVGKALTTRLVGDAEAGEEMRLVSPRHADRGRSYLAYRLPELGLPPATLRAVLALVGHHHDVPRVLETGTPAVYRRLARQVSLPLLYLLEQADLRGRVGEGQAGRLDDLDLFRMQAQDYGLWDGGDPYRAWAEVVGAVLAGAPPALLDRTLGQGVLDHEAGRIRTPEEAVARAYRARGGFAELVVVCGPSGSGKSTWIAGALPDYEVVSLDDLRGRLAGRRADQAMNGQVMQAAREALRAALRRNGKVVWDATGLRRDFRRTVLGLGMDYGALTTLAVFQPRPGDLGARNLGRAHAVPGAVLAAQLAGAEFPYLPEAHRTLWVDGDGQTTGQAGFSSS
ncbi:phosphohydrolase [Deinococcus sp. Leaf326]|nr:phosphohydrolase [Deinococcus sp. Leaf326]